uniref:CID domain-containing protein n=1 Tax=Manihot esculenta TaxID=3983 RepID=A0A2C9W323_MANES
MLGEMGSSFNPQILVEKLTKLNHSQASIETLSHWCIFHMNKAKQVVETWDRQFHCSPREQRLAFLYLANDILQNSRRKGSEFVGEFWKVLPDALRDVIENGDEAGRNAALRLIGIWEDRKVFGSRGQILKEELVGKHSDGSNRNGKSVGFKLQPTGSTLDKIISGYQVVDASQVDEDVIINKCRSAISSLEKAEKEIGVNINSGQFHATSFVEELQGQHTILRDSIEQLTAIESSRASLVSHLRDALQEQEYKLEQIRSQLQAGQSQSEHASNVCQKLLRSGNMQLVGEQGSKEVGTSIASQNFRTGDREQSVPTMYTRQAPFPEKTGQIEEDPRKSAAAAVAAKLTASTSSAQMLSFVLSSLASEGGIGNPIKESSGDYASGKRAKLENDQPYIPTQNPPQQPLPPFQHPESFQVATSGQQLTSNDPPPPPSSPPPPPPLPPMQPYSIPQYMQTAGSINNVPYNYSMSQQQPPSLPGYPGVGTQMTGIAPYTMPPSNSYPSYQGSDGTLYSQQSSMPISRQ